MDIHQRIGESCGIKNVTEFWRLVQSIGWNDSMRAKIVKADLIRQLKPGEAERFTKILTKYVSFMTELYAAYLTHTGESLKTDYNVVLCAASNIVGGGKLNYDEFVRTPQSIKYEIDSASIGDCFSRAIPTDDDYFSHYE